MKTIFHSRDACLSESMGCLFFEQQLFFNQYTIYTPSFDQVTPVERSICSFLIAVNKRIA